MKKFSNAKSDVARVQLENIRLSLDLFTLDVGRYPNEEEGLKILIEQPEGLDRWSGPYLKSNEVPKDPWGGVYVYTTPVNKGKPYSQKSYGAYVLPGDPQRTPTSFCNEKRSWLFTAGELGRAYNYSYDSAGVIANRAQQRCTGQKSGRCHYRCKLSKNYF